MRGCVIPVALMHLSLSLSHQQRGISHRYGRLLGYISGERERRLKSRPLNTQSNSAAPISWCLLSTAHTQPTASVGVEREIPPISHRIQTFSRELKKKKAQSHTKRRTGRKWRSGYIYYMDRNYIQYILEHLKKKRRGAYMYQGSRNIVHEHPTKAMSIQYSGLLFFFFLLLQYQRYIFILLYIHNNISHQGRIEAERL